MQQAPAHSGLHVSKSISPRTRPNGSKATGHASRRRSTIESTTASQRWMMATTTFFLVSTDICTISPTFYDSFCRKLEDETGIKPSQIWWSTTHTHSAPHVGPQDLGRLFAGTLGDRFSIQHDTAYWTWVTDTLMKGIQEAQAQLKPARLGIGSGEAHANVNRRELRNGRTVLGVNLDGPVDRQLGLIRLEGIDGKPIGFIANYAIHGTSLGGKNRLISGDAIGFATEYAEQKLGAPVLFANGAVGNVAPRYSVGADWNNPHLKEYTTLLGDPIVAVNASISETTSNVTFSTGTTWIETPRRKGLNWPDNLKHYASVSDEGVEQMRIPIYSLVINRDTVILGSAPGTVL